MTPLQTFPGEHLERSAVPSSAGEDTYDEAALLQHFAADLGVTLPKDAFPTLLQLLSEGIAPDQLIAAIEAIQAERLLKDEFAG